MAFNGIRYKFSNFSRHFYLIFGMFSFFVLRTPWIYSFYRQSIGIYDDSIC